jgi:hypothetical protein
MSDIALTAHDCKVIITALDVFVKTHGLEVAANALNTAAKVQAQANALASAPAVPQTPPADPTA